MGGNKGRDIRELTRTRSGKRKRKGPRRKPKRRTRRPGRVNPRKISLEDLERGLRASPAGKEISVADLERDLEAGFQPNSDGTIDLVRYVAWLLRRHGYGRADA